MQLMGSPTSPFVRKVRVYLAETAIACPFAAVDAWQPDARLLAVAPLGKVPVLVRDDGTALFDTGSFRIWMTTRRAGMCCVGRLWRTG